MDGLASFDVAHDWHVALGGDVLLDHAEHHFTLCYKGYLGAAGVGVDGVASAGAQCHQRLPIAISRQGREKRILHSRQQPNEFVWNVGGLGKLSFM